MKATLLFPAAIILFSCNNGSDGPADGTDNDSAAVTALPPEVIDLSAHDLPLLLAAPDKRSAEGAEVTMGWHEEEGWFAVKAGDRFSLHITEGPGDIARLKRDLEGDLLRKHTIITETPELVVYRSEFPDDPTLVFVHFYQVISSGDRSFIVESDPDGKFNEADVERMRTAISPKTPA